eukprot:TRINITY_DN6844_c0_g1_i1.p1 TRINITY_DN6844_c0_g1~~TRINITY_DN6844_c0_g1_i1.p1  ORF type:complete len:435 (+),score=39.83 TRINITY_DN6844_c0_g1_i1:167-1306(+)
MVLGDMGAEVIKIENPKGGDDTRSWGPPFTPSGESAYFLSINRNKKSVAIDLKKPEGVEIIRNMSKQCDVLIENFLPGKADELGIGYEALKEINPNLIYCSLTGYGPDGPYQHRLAYDVMISALGGLLGITGPEDGPPVKVGVAITDIVTGLFAHGAILAGLLHRFRFGGGQRIDTSLLECQVAALANVASNYLISGQLPKRMGTAHSSIVPYQAFQTQDGYIVLGALNDSQFQRLCQGLGLAEVAADDKYKTNPARVHNRSSLLHLLQQVLSTHTSDHWLHLLHHCSLPVAPINDLAQVFADAQILHRGMLQKVKHPHQELPLVGIPVKFQKTHSTIRLPPPLLGQHTRQVLHDTFGYSPSLIQDWTSQGICYQNPIT